MIINSPKLVYVKLDLPQFANLIQVEEKLKKSAKHI